MNWQPIIGENPPRRRRTATTPTTTHRKRAKQKGRREGGTFAALPHAVIDSENWRRCSATAIKVLCALMRQYNGINNGDLCAAKSTLKPLGWKSSDTITWAIRELRHYGLIALTRQGHLDQCSLFALTWHPIDECKGKLEVPSTRVAPGDWRMSKARFKRPPKNKKPHRQPDHTPP